MGIVIEKRNSRSRVDTIIDILEAAKGGADKTSIADRTNLNFALAYKYIELLQKQGLLENRSDKYITAEKGKLFLERARELTCRLELSES